MQLATFKRSAKLVVRFVINVRRSKLSSFKMTTRGLALHVWPWADNSEERLGTALQSILQSGFGPPQTTTCSGSERSPERSPLRDWRGSAGSCAKLVARSWNGLLQQRHFQDSATLPEMEISGWRFCRKVIKMPGFYSLHLFFVCVLPFHCRINVLITFGTTLVMHSDVGH
jgi:hypothetical protein